MSVIIPVYNVEDYLEECIDSIVNQTLKDIEIICVNDGSKDGSEDIVKKYAKDDSRIKLINKENGGLSSARNVGIREASGEYIIFLDSDDYLETYALEYLYYEAKKDGLDQLFFSAAIFYDGCKKSIKNDYYIRKNDYTNVVSGQELFAKWVENAEFKPSACLQINRTAYLKENNLYFKEGIIHEDNLFTIQCMYYSKKVRYANINLYNRRVRENSIMTGTQNFKHAYHLYLIVMELKKFALRENVSKNRQYYEALIIQLDRVMVQVANYAKNLSEEELKEHIYEMNEEEAINFYVCTFTASKAKASAARVSDRARNAEDNFRVLRFRSRMQREKLNEEIDSLKEELNKLESSKTFKAGKVITYIPGRIKAILTRKK